MREKYSAMEKNYLNLTGHDKVTSARRLQDSAQTVIVTKAICLQMFLREMEHFSNLFEWDLNTLAGR